MKKMAFVGPINNGWALLTFGEMEEEMMDVRLATLSQFIDGEVYEEDFLELTFAEDEKTLIGARKLVEETRQRKQEAIAQRNRLLYGISRGPNEEQLPDKTQQRLHFLMEKNTDDTITEEEVSELEELVKETQTLMLQNTETLARVIRPDLFDKNGRPIKRRIAQAVREKTSHT
jgi:hypothetical protein